MRREAGTTASPSSSLTRRDGDIRPSAIESEARPLSSSLEEDGTGDESTTGGRTPSICGFLGVVSTEDEDLDCDCVPDLGKLIFKGKPYATRQVDTLAKLRIIWIGHNHIPRSPGVSS